MSFVERLNELIEKSNLTHKEIAEKTCISAGNVSHYRTGKVKPSFDAIIDLAYLFNVSTDWLLLGHKSSQNIDQKHSTNPLEEELIGIFRKMPTNTQLLLINTAKTFLQHDVNSNPIKAPSTSTTTASDEQAATRSETA